MRKQDVRSPYMSIVSTVQFPPGAFIITMVSVYDGNGHICISLREFLTDLNLDIPVGESCSR